MLCGASGSTQRPCARSTHRPSRRSISSTARSRIEETPAGGGDGRPICRRSTIKTKDLQRSAEDLRNDEQSDVQDTFRQVASKVGLVVVSYARQQGFGVVLGAGEQNSALLWWTPCHQRRILPHPCTERAFPGFVASIASLIPAFRAAWIEPTMAIDQAVHSPQNLDGSVPRHPH